MAFTAQPKGGIGVDQGARQALTEQGRSLLASGVRRVEGSFRKGDLVSIRDDSGEEFARGLVSYSHADLERMKGMKSQEIEVLLGRRPEEVVHRDSLVVLRK